MYIYIKSIYVCMYVNISMYIYISRNEWVLRLNTNMCMAQAQGVWPGSCRLLALFLFLFSDPCQLLEDLDPGSPTSSAWRAIPAWRREASRLWIWKSGP